MSNDQIYQNKPFILSLAHLLLQVSDLNTAERFYCEILGLEVINRSTFGGDRPLTVTKQGLGITLLPNPPVAPEKRNVEHVAFWVQGMDQLIKRLKDTGFSPSEPKSNEYGKSISVNDPDGNRIELIENMSKT